MRLQWISQRTWRRMLAAGVAAGLAGVAQPAQPGWAEQAFGVEVLRPPTAAEPEPQAEPASDEATGEPTAAATSAGEEPVVLVLDVVPTSLTIEPELVRPHVVVRGWDPGTPSQLRVIGPDTADPSRIPVRGWEPEEPSQLRVHSWSAGTP
jgi:hypothetical protein